LADAGMGGADLHAGRVAGRAASGRCIL
ncbi:cell envelope biogenesis protein OmpA, partial [Yersinia pestis]